MSFASLFSGLKARLNQPLGGPGASDPRSTRRWLIQISGPFIFWRLLSILVVGLLAGGVFFAARFMYQTIYTTISNTNAIVVLSSNLSVQGINVETYLKTRALIEAKNAPVAIPLSGTSTTLGRRNIFKYDSAPAAPINSTTSPRSGTPAE